ncbi:MAG: GNAT family N-acetyltransferase [Pseudomonadota bacterium]
MAHLAGTPTLETERLILRAPALQDWETCRAFMATERARFTGGIRSEHEAWRGFGHIVGHWALRGFGSFVFCDRATGATLGLAGPWYPSTWPEREIGWSVWRDEAEGKGYAFEAARAAIAHAFDTLGWDSAVSYIDPDNARSIALAERLGAVRDAAAPRPDPTDLVYRHPKPGADA